MRTETPPAIRLSDYKPYPFRINKVRLHFNLEPASTLVCATLDVSRLVDEPVDMQLDGEKIELLSVSLNGLRLDLPAYETDADGMTIHNPGAEFQLTIETRISPETNSELSGLYMSAGRFCSQCEAEGFRRITYFPDRPDVLAPYFVRIEADKVGFPFLLSNGNPVDNGELEGGRHFAEWDDPHPKPSYLFAVVAGDFDQLKDTFRTRSGRDVALSINVEKGDAPRAAYAMDSLKHAMKWDEDVFGREYDLDVFQIVAVRDFNFGAMENKGLNIFNSAYVLADGDTATDADFEAIESIVAHEYFHNWTGNRITCRDWFQLCLKEGLTVYRDQEFSQTMRSRAVGRIKDVIRLRARQFAEDGGPLAHAVRPDAYARIDNLYTATVYEKGAEIIRMLRLLIGENAFWSGMNTYFDEQDGKAATIEDFVGSFQHFTPTDLATFSRWYAQAGTPLVEAAVTHDANARELCLTLSQTTRPTPGQPEKKPLLIPLRVALFDSNGAKITARLGDDTSDEHVVVLDDTSAEFVFANVPSPARASLNRGFSAPIRLADNLDEAGRCALAGTDDDPFAKWDALQRVARAIIQDALKSGEEPDPGRVAAWTAAVATSVEASADNDPAFAALLLYVPTVNELVQEAANADPDAIQQRRTTLRRAIAKTIEPLLIRFAELPSTNGFSASPEAASLRALKVSALSVLSVLGSTHEARISAAFRSAATMTESLGALNALSSIEGPAFDTALADFETRWKHMPLIMDKWYGTQCGASRSDIRERLDRLRQRDDFDLRNPNRVRALAAAFAMNNTVSFHAADGWGYRFLQGMILDVDKLNPALSARLATAFESWRAFSEDRQAHARKALEDLSMAGLSRNAQDIVDRALATN